MRFFISLLILVFISSCSRGYLESLTTYYDHNEAYQICQNLKNQTLVVQIPCEGRKHALLKSQYENEDNVKKKEKLKKKYDENIKELVIAQSSIFNGFQNYFDFTEVIFIPDTLVTQFKKGRRNKIFLDKEYDFYSNDSIPNSDKLLFVRSLRDFDHLYIHKMDGSLPPKPFPFSSTVQTGNINIIARSEKTSPIENNEIYVAIVTMNRRLKNFYSSVPPLPKSQE